MTSIDDGSWTITMTATGLSGLTLLPGAANAHPTYSFTADFTSNAPLMFTITQDAANTSSDLKDIFYPTIKNDSGTQWKAFRISYIDVTPPDPGIAGHPNYAHFHDASDVNYPGWLNPITGSLTSALGFNTTINSPQVLNRVATINGSNELQLSGGTFFSGTQQNWTGIDLHQFTSNASGGGNLIVVLTPLATPFKTISAVGQQFTLSDNVFAENITAANTKDGYLIAEWEDQNTPGGHFVAGLQVFTGDGRSAGNTQFPAVSTQNVLGASVAALSTATTINTGTVTSWVDGNTNTVFSQILGSGGPIIVSTAATSPHTATGSLGTGGFAVAYSHASGINNDIFIQQYDAAGTRQGGPIDTVAVNTSTVDLAVLSNGNYAVVGDQSNGHFEFGLVTTGGIRLGGLSFVGRDSSITALRNGGFVIVYDTYVSGNSGPSLVEAQVFSPNGTTLGGPIYVHTMSNSALGHPDVAAMPDGNFVISWTDTSPDVLMPTVEARVFDQSGGAVTNVTAVSTNHDAVATVFGSTVAALSNTSFAVLWTDLNGSTPSGVGQVLSIPNDVAPANDFNGDGRADILFQNSDGTPAVWLMNGTGVSSFGPALPNPGPTWHELAAADFNGDGKADILFQNDNGTPAVWLMDGTNVSSFGPPLPNPGPSWHAKEAADFNGDGKADILFQNDNGTAAVWLMNGTSLSSFGPQLPNPGPTWHEMAAADFNGDGKADILWQNDNGTPAVWLMDGVNVTSFGPALPNPGTAWHAKAAADFNGDGKADILWQHDNGTPAVWLMDGVNVTNFGPALPNPGPAWHVKEAEDFNGDGKADILFQHDNGTPAVWLMDGTNVSVFGPGLPNPTAAWHVI